MTKLKRKLICLQEITRENDTIVDLVDLPIIDYICQLIVGYVSDDYSTVARTLIALSSTALRDFPLHNCKVSEKEWLDNKHLHLRTSPRIIYDLGSNSTSNLNSFFMSTPFLKNLTFSEVICFKD